MTKQTIFLFLRAFIIGILLNAGIQFVSDSSPLAQQEIAAPQQTTRLLSQPLSNTETQVLGQVNVSSQ